MCPILLKAPENDTIHKIFIELMAQKVNCFDSYKRVIEQVDNDKIPFSLGGEFILAAKKNPEIKNLYAAFKSDSKILKCNVF